MKKEYKGIYCNKSSLYIEASNRNDYTYHNEKSNCQKEKKPKQNRKGKERKEREMAGFNQLGTQAEVVVLSATRMNSGEVRGIKILYMFANDLSPVAEDINTLGVAVSDTWSENMGLWSDLIAVPGHYMATMKWVTKKMKPTVVIDSLEYIDEVRLDTVTVKEQPKQDTSKKA